MEEEKVKEFGKIIINWLVENKVKTAEALNAFQALTLSLCNSINMSKEDVDDYFDGVKKIYKIRKE